MLVDYLGPWAAGKGSLQQKLTRALIQTIRHGLLTPGLRLPSERNLAQALSLSRTTVVAAYDNLREGGWVESRSGSGTQVCIRSEVVAAARNAAQAGVLSASPLLGLLANHDRPDMIDFALGTPLALTGVPVELFSVGPEEQTALIKDHRYYPMGLEPLRRAIAASYMNSGVETTYEQVLVTNGAQQAIALCAALFVQRGDTVLVEDPAYFGALDAFRAVGARISPLPVPAKGVRPSVIRDRISATAARLVYLTPTFQNPTGEVMPKAARKEIAQIVTELGVPVIDDTTVADITFGGAAPPPIAIDCPNGMVLSIGSLSKLVWAGLRIGWVRAPEPVIQRLARLKSAADLGSPILTQRIAVRLLGALDEFRKLRRLQLQPRRDLLVTLLKQHLPEWKFRVPAGGLFLWVKLPHGDSREFAQVAARHGVIVLPGPVMSAGDEHVRFLRLPFLAQSEILTNGVSRLASAWRDYKSSDRPQTPGTVTLV
ncbi:MAG: PLP-dependent aminotransferase family protein [Bryobacterales bacterium]|nr:PLP-dependent aminotransferase family protein [Bryobacterales bacterium]